MMTHEEKYTLYCRALEAEKNGNFAKAGEFRKLVPLSYKSAMAAKEVCVG